MSISSRITEIETHIEDIYDTLEIAGEDLTNTNKNIVNINTSLENRLKDYLASGINVVWGNWNKSTVTGSNINLSGTIKADILFTSYKGQTTQSGTPTPSSPVTVNVVSGRQDVVVAGKNLLDNKAVSGEQNGVTYTINADKSITLNGTSTQAFIFDIDNGRTLPAGTYTLSLKNKIVGCGIYLYVNQTLKTYVSSYNDSNDYATTFTLNEETVFNEIRIDIQNGKTFNNLTIYPMIEVGSTATTYEAYKGGTYEINLGKNILNAKDGSYTYNTTHTWDINSDVVTLSVNNVSVQGGSINLTTGVTGTWATSNNQDNHLTDNGGTYTLSLLKNGTITYGTSGNLYAYIILYDNAGNKTATNYVLISKTEALTTITLTLDSDKHIGEISLYSQYISCEDITLKIQLEKGSTATSFSPYKTPIELCKIGDYQDFIRKGTGKNLANIENIQINKQWTGGYNSNRASILNIPIEPNTQYSIVGSWLNSHITQVRVVSFANIGDSIPIEVFTGTFTSPTTANYVSVEVLADTAFTSAMLEGLIVMLCEGSDTTYEPYGYNGKWYLEKNISKVILNGSEAGWYIAQRQNNVYRAYRIFNDVLSVSSRQLVLSNYFNFAGNNETIGNIFSYDTTIYFYTNITTVNDWKTWLGTNNTTIYYVLATPTYTEITDSELLGQLEGNKKSCDGQTNISVNTLDLPFIMSATILKELS